MAVIVAKKTEKIAVRRNKIRRRVFEIVRKSKELENKSVDVVFVVHDAEVGVVGHDELVVQVNKALKKINSSL